MAERADPATVEVALPQDLTAPSAARSATKGVLRRWRVPGLLDPVLLTVSELVGNAVRHGRPPVHMWLRRTARGGVQVDVHDEASAPPGVGVAAPDAESGRGLILVDAVAEAVGVDQIEDDGKIVWARIEPDPSKDHEGTT